MKRRDALKTIGLGAASVALGKGCAPRSGSRKPNIIFIMSDDHASHALSCYGGKINKTPNLDRLADQGVRFENCFCTNSICAPSRAVILTGKYSHLNGVIDNSREFDGSQQTFPKRLQQSGYETAMIGKWHLKSDPAGFDYWNILPGQGDYYNPDLIEMGERKRYEGYVTDIITDIVLAWLDSRTEDKPFCLMYHHKAPHRAWMPGPDHLKLYDGEEIPEPETLFDDWATKSDAARQQEMTVARHMMDAYDLKITPTTDERDGKLRQGYYSRLNEEQRKAWDDAYGPRNQAFHKAGLRGRELVRYKYQRYIKDYLRCIASVDDNVGRLLDYLDREGLTGNTVVVYTSDQGFYLGDHGWFDKRFMYEESLRMPLLVRYPKEIKPGTANDDMVLNIDFAPTFLDYAGADVPSDMQGRSIRPVLAGKTPADWREAMYYHYYEYPAVHMVKRHYGIRTGRYKLMHYYYDIDAWELYDLDRDPEELNNVYGDPAYDDVVKELRAELAVLREKYGDSDELARKFLREDLESR